MSYTKIYLLPRNAIGHVCQIQPYFSISSFIPPREQKINQRSVDLSEFYEDHCEDCDYREQYDEEDEEYYGECEGGEYVLKGGGCQKYNYADFKDNTVLKIKTLPYIFQVRMYFANGSVDLGSTYLLTYDPEAFEQGKLMAIPYCTGNVYSGSGNVCWGGTFNRIDENLVTPRLAHSMFWESTFNNDLIPSSDILPVWLKDLTASKLRRYTKDWEDYTKNVKGEVYISTDEKVEGIFFSNEPSVTRKFKKTMLYKHNSTGRNRRGVLGWLKRGEYRLSLRSTTSFNGLYVTVGEETFVWNSDANTIGKRVYVGPVPEVVIERPTEDQLLDKFMDEMARAGIQNATHTTPTTENKSVEVVEMVGPEESGLVIEMLSR